MYKDRTQANILREMLANAPTDCNKQEGTLIHAALAVEAEKIEDAYIELDSSYNNCMADTCDREHLIRRALERGLEPKAATHAIYRAIFNCEVRVGERFWQRKYHFKVLEQMAPLQYKVVCEETGKKTNNCFGQVEPVEYIAEFESGSIVELLIPAEDEQDTEDFRREYYDSIASPSYAGNIPFYVKEVGKLDGVGYCKPIPITKPHQVIECIIVDSQWKAPSQELVAYVQNVVDPETDVNSIGKEYGLPEISSYKGLGYGIAPAFQDVLIRGVQEIVIDLTGTLEIDANYDYSLVMEKVEAAVDRYFAELAAGWKDVPYIVVRSSYIMSSILDVDGVIDVGSIHMGKGEENIKLEYDQIPIRGRLNFK